MNNFKNMFLTISTLLCSQIALPMEQSPQPPKGTQKLPTFLEYIQKSVPKKLEKKLPSTPAEIENLDWKKKIDKLPKEIKREIFLTRLLVHYPNLPKLAESIADFKNSLDTKILLSLLKALPYTANAISLAQYLQDLPNMQDPQITTWLNTAKGHLEKGLELKKAILFKNDPQLVLSLLNDRNLDLNHSVGQGLYSTSPLTIACYHQKIITQLLLSAGADPNLMDQSGQTPLVKAAEGGDIEILKMILAAGANIDSQDTFNNTALIQAARSECPTPEIVRILLAAGADPLRTNSSGHSALESVRRIIRFGSHAPKDERTEIIKLLTAAQK